MLERHDQQGPVIRSKKLIGKSSPENSMKANYGNKVRFTATFLCLITAQAAVLGYVIGSPLQDTQRKIVSDDFTKSRREAVVSTPRRKSPKLNRRTPRRTYRLASNPIAEAQTSSAANNIAELGITIWRLRQATPTDSGRRARLIEKGKSLSWLAERRGSDAIFREGDYLRISVESPRAGYLYVVDRDLLADGTTGGAMLIYPWSKVDNQLLPGRLIDIPAQEDNPSYFAARLTATSQIGELLTFIVTPTPLDLPISEKPFEITAGQLKDWENMWCGPSERFEMDGGVGEVWTREEQQAAVRNGTRQLTRDDPPPQTIYRVATSNTNPFIVNVRLRYRK